MKKKKISFKFSIIKSKNPDKNKDGEVVYPVYLKVIFNRHSTRFILPDYIEHGEEYSPIRKITLKEYEDENFSLDAGLEDYLEKIVRYEYDKVGDKYTLVGLNLRAVKYSTPILNVLSNELGKYLLMYLGDHFTYNEFNKILTDYKQQGEVFENIYSAFDEFNFISTYHFYQDKRFTPDIPHFPLIKIFPKIYKKRVASVMKFLIFRMEFFRKDCRIIDWLADDSILLTFKGFIESESYKESEKILLDKHPILEKIFQDYESEMSELSSKETILIINNLVKNSEEMRNINQQLST